MQSHVKRYESMTDRMGVRSLAGWMSRSLGAMRADLEYVDSGSVDVLLYCIDHVDAGEPREVEDDRPR
jgi:hypothetical protein